MITTLVCVCTSLIIISAYYIIRPLPWNIQINPFLVDEQTGQIIESRTFVDPGKVIKQEDSYLNSTSPIAKLFDLVQQYHYEVHSHPDQFYEKEQDLLISGWTHANQTKCRQDLQEVLDYLNANSNYQSNLGLHNHQIAKYLDSFGRPGSSLFSG